MPHSRMLLRICALFALGLLLNAQAMACCWSMPKASPNEMPANHACCKKPALPTDGSHAVSAQQHLGCNGEALTHALITASESGQDFTLAANPFTFSFEENVRHQTLLENTHFDTGPPRFLALQRLLI